MQPFPVTSSILSTNHLAVFVQDVYQLSPGATCTLLKTGINHSYLINDGNTKFIFRLYSLNWRSRLEIEEEIRLLNLLRDNDIAVSYPIADSGGDYIRELPAPEGNRFGVLFSFAEGEKHLNFSAELHYKVGETMARIHQVTKGLELQRVNYTPKVVLHDPIIHLNKFLPAESEEMKWLLAARDYLFNAVSRVDESKVRKGVIHLDIWFDNFNITKDNKITLFDFDFCGKGWLCYDVAYYILQLHSTEKDETERELKKKSFFAGYESIVKLSDEERALLPLLGVSLYIFYLGVQCQRYDNWSNVFLNETYLKRFINLLIRKYFEENVSADALIPRAE